LGFSIDFAYEPLHSVALLRYMWSHYCKRSINDVSLHCC